MSNSVSTASSDRRVLAVAVLLFVAAFALRLCGITWGLANDLHNTSLHPDESVVYLNYAYRPNPLVPNNYNYPSLYPVLLRVAGDMAATYGGVDSPFGMPPPTSAEDQAKQQAILARHERVVNLAGRMLSSLAGAGTAVVIFFLLLRFAGMAGAVFGGALVAVAPAFVVHSRFQTVDVTATFFLWVAMLYAVQTYASDRETKAYARNAVLTGVFAGLAMGTKYSGFVALASLLVAMLLNRRSDWIKVLLLSCAACVVLFLITTPGAILDTSQFLFGLRLEADHVRQGELTFEHTPTGFICQIGNLLTGIGLLGFLIGVGGLVYGAVTRNRFVWVIFPAILIYYVLIGPTKIKYIRYALPLVPGVACGFGYAIGGAMKRPRYRIAGAAIGFVALAGVESLAFQSYRPSPYWASFDPRFGGLFGTIDYTKDMMAEDPMDTAARKVKELTAGDPNAAVGIFRTPWYWTVPVIKDAVTMFALPADVHDQFVAAYLAQTHNPRVQYDYDSPPAKYAVLTSLETNEFDRIGDPSQVSPVWRRRYESLQPVLDDVRANYKVIESYGGEVPAVPDLMYVQPKAYVLVRK